MRRSLSALVLLLALPAMAQQAAPQQKLQSTLKELNQSKAQQEKIERELKETESALGDMRSRATNLAETMQDTERRASNAERNLSKLDGELAAKEKDFAARKQEYAATLASLLRMREVPPTAIFVEQDEADRMMRSAAAMKATNRALAQRAAQLKYDTERLTRLRSGVAQTRTTVQREQSQLQEQRKQLNADLATRQRLQEKLQRDHADARTRIAKFSRESASLKELIGKIEASRATPQFAASTARPSPAPTRGNLKAPVAGSVVHKFGERKNANETYRGMVLSARPGGTVVSPAAGEVVFTGPFMDYGRMVLLKHGNGYISLLAGMGSIAVGLNQQVGAGEPLGSMGGGSPRLYVELREKSKPIDPARWFGNLGSNLAKR